MKIQKQIIKHWNSACNDLIEWVVLDSNNNVIYTARTKKMAVAFVNGGK
jgi:hypothetical protein